jgi:transposase
MEELIADNQRLKMELAEQLQLNVELRKLHDALTLELARLQRQLFGQKAERVSTMDTQLALTGVLEALGRLPGGVSTPPPPPPESSAAAADKKPKKPKKAAPHGRRDVSAEKLPSVTIVIEPPERKLAGGELLQKIGEEISHHIDYRPASLVRVEVIRPKYLCPEDVGTSSTSAPTTIDEALEGDSPAPLVNVLVAEKPSLPIEKGLAGAGLLAIILVQKYADHLPLHRQVRIFARQGLKLARSTMGDFVCGAVKLLAHIVEAMWKESRETAPIILTDGTGVLILEKEKCRRGHFYVFIDVGRHVVFRYLKTNDGPSVASALADFSGILQSDASSVYHLLQRTQPGIIEAGCWAHGRRGLFESLSTAKDLALIGIGFVSKLYEAHRAALRQDGTVDAIRRKALAQPILNDFSKWVRQERVLAEVGSPIEVALGYFERQWVPLTRFLEDGRIRLDNNPSELELRHEVVGRRNWLFCASDTGAEWNATTVSLIASCRLHDIEPWAYLRDVLTLLPGWPKARVLELAPANWLATRQRPQTQDLLAQLSLIDSAAPRHSSDTTVTGQ